MQAYNLPFFYTIHRKIEMKELIDITTAKVRFSEVDSMQIVWHGNYVQFLEDGREHFGEHFGLSYDEVRKQGYMMPVVKVDMDYKRSLHYGETVTIKTKYVAVDAAKVIFDYELFRNSDQKKVMSARTIQVFTDLEGTLQFHYPAFAEAWKKKHLSI